MMKLLDLFCGAGGAAMGYSRAGFTDIVGVDIKPQPRYPFTFVRADALEYVTAHGHEFDAIHASPPCQGYANVTRWRGDQSSHARLIEATRAALSIFPVWVIENVRTPAIEGHAMLCGSLFDLPIRRHRYFEMSTAAIVLTPSCRHRDDDAAYEHKQERAYADAMGCDWMSAREAREAIPPAYTEFIGRQLRQALCAR